MKRASRNERHFNEEQLQLARRTISRQHSGPTDAPSQARMTPYGLPRQILLAGSAASEVVSSSHGLIGLQYGSNQVTDFVQVEKAEGTYTGPWYGQQSRFQARSKHQEM